MFNDMIVARYEVCDSNLIRRSVLRQTTLGDRYIDFYENGKIIQSIKLDYDEDLQYSEDLAKDYVFKKYDVESPNTNQLNLF